MKELFTLLAAYSDYQITMTREAEYPDELMIEIVFVKDNEKVQMPFRLKVVQLMMNPLFTLNGAFTAAAAAFKEKGF